MKFTSRSTPYRSSSNNAPPIPSYRVGIKIKSAPEEKYNEELTAGIGDDSTYYPLVIYYDLNMGNITLWWMDFGKRYWK